MTRMRLILPVLAFVVAAQTGLPVAVGQLAGGGGEVSPLQAGGAEALAPELKKSLDAWEDYIHYLRVANLELATSAGTAFLNAEMAPEQLLNIIEEYSTYKDYDTTLTRAEKLEGAAGQLAKDISAKISGARLDVAREGSRIRQSIELLDDGLRHRVNAQARLKRAGEYAAPQLLAVLLSTDPTDQQLRPYVIETMVELGRPLVAPLSVSLSQLPAVAKQQVAEVLARIGYPLALPYLKAELDRKDIQDDTRKVLNIAYTRILERTGVPASTGADRLFYMLAEDYYYGREDLIAQPDAPNNLMWTYESGSTLRPVEIPTPVFIDVMAMQASRRALQLNPDLSAAMSLWLAANFRRENNLPDGASDPSYGKNMRSPMFYAELAGPRHLHPVLQRALGDEDPALALDVIAALNATAGTYSLLNIDGDIQPLIQALSYPDRRVRFEAAFTIARSMPRASFSGAQRVVPVLAEAVREQASDYAVAIAPDTEALNNVSGLIQAAEAKTQILLGNNVEVAAAQIATAPGVDVIVIDLPVDQAVAAVANARRLPKLSATPVVVLAASENIIAVNRLLGQQPMVIVTDRAAEKEKIVEAIKQSLASGQGAELSDEQALGYATTSLDMIKSMVLTRSPVFEAQDAQPAVVEALADKRDPVVLGAAEVLALMPNVQAQVKLADAALADRAPALQVSLLQALARSARLNGNQINEIQLRNLMKLVQSSTGPLADAAAEAHGALNLPTSNAVKFVTTGE
ncbi:hypothetical protein HED60_20710 [Planctomycetales bacterium ZRK34]|nr:hypothetical protein HED60_20710 [Planctomycetales bacterium ZRK34]